MNSHKKVVVFSGPSINVGLRAKYSQFIFREPAQQGNILQVAQLCNVSTIVLLDGFYKTVPAVWHKEIIFALDKGINVVGASSLGALRAVELEDFGMIGHGDIFNWFKEGTLYRDPDVAVAHAGIGDDYKQLTIPIVNIYATLKDSPCRFSLGLINQVLDISREIFFEVRTFETLIRAISNSNLVPETQKLVINSLRSNYVDQKLLDTQSALSYVASIDFEDIKEASSTLNHTLYWNALSINDSYVFPESSGLLSTKQAFIAFQLLENPEDFMRMRERAISVELCQWLATIYNLKATENEINNMMAQFLDDRSLTENTLDQWLRERGLTKADALDYLNACVVEDKVKTMAQFKNVLCPFNRFHYMQAVFDFNAEPLLNTFKKMNEVLADELINPVEELTDSKKILPLKTFTVIDYYRKLFLIPNQRVSFSSIIRFPFNYVLYISRIHNKYKETVANKIKRFFN